MKIAIIFAFHCESIIRTIVDHNRTLNLSKTSNTYEHHPLHILTHPAIYHKISRSYFMHYAYHIHVLICKRIFGRMGKFKCIPLHINTSILDTKIVLTHNIHVYDMYTA